MELRRYSLHPSQWFPTLRRAKSKGKLTGQTVWSGPLIPLINQTTSAFMSNLKSTSNCLAEFLNPLKLTLQFS